MMVVPVPFSMEGGHRLQHAKWLLEETEEDGSSLVVINKDAFHKLVTALRTAIAIEYKLDKEQTSYNILDAFRLSLQFYKRSKN
jgi:cell division GTPase FtsZ